MLQIIIKNILIYEEYFSWLVTLQIMEINYTK